jgi:hypothetical protein
MSKSISSKKVFDRNYLIEGRVPKDLELRFDEWRQLRNLPFGKDARNDTWKLMLEIVLNETQFLDQELIKKLGNVFIEGTLQEKLNLIVDNFLKWHEKFPYLTVQREITPEDADFLPCTFVKAIYWQGEFLGFSCRLKSPPLDLPRMKVGKLSFKVVTPEDCCDCQELCKNQKVGVDVFRHISIEMIEKQRKEIRLSKESKSDYEKTVDQILAEEGIRRNYKEVKAIFEQLIYDNNAKKWKRIDEASKKTGVSRPTIYKLIETFPEGVH